MSTDAGRRRDSAAPSRRQRAARRRLRGFVLGFVGVAAAIGLVGALGCALALKHARLPPVAQVSAMLLCAYGTYLVCEVVDQSGIVGALVCGFGMKK